MHTCYRCGGSCQGPGARVAASERAGLAEHASMLGIEAPIRGDQLRVESGRCVFLQQDNLCGLHMAFGPTAKPESCRAFPYLLPSGRDPGCLADFLTAPAPPDGILPGVVGRSIEHSLASLLGEPSRVGQPPPAVARWLMEALPDILGALLSPSAAPALRARLRHLETLRTSKEPAWPDLPERTVQYALDVTRRTVHLDASERADDAVAWDTLRGAALCAWANRALPRFGPALSAWTRLQRRGALRDVLDRSPLPRHA